MRFRGRSAGTTVRPWTSNARVGKPQAIGLYKIASPQDKPKMPPCQAADRDDVQDGSRMVDRLRVEQQKLQEKTSTADSQSFCQPSTIM